MGFAVSSWWGSLGFATMVAVEIMVVGFHDEVAVEIIVGFAMTYCWFPSRFHGWGWLVGFTLGIVVVHGVAWQCH